jgi:hypothetical protein
LLMVSQSQGKSRRRVIHEYSRSLHEKSRDKKRLRKRVGEPASEEKPAATEREISDKTLKRLHTLGIQKFGSSPFSEHFDRWLFDVAAVLDEFEKHPSISLDEQFVEERSQTLDNIKRQLEHTRRKEFLLNQEIAKRSDSRSRLQQINSEYVTMAKTIRSRKNAETRRQYIIINRLKKEQDIVIRLKTGFFRGISKKDREQKELEISQQLDDQQNQLELAMLNFKAEQKVLREEYEKKREPTLERIKQFQKMVQSTESDGSLEERWLACEALIDSVNNFLQRKANNQK